jgi:hypothetical protein
MIWNKKYYQENKIKISIQRKKYYEDNKETLKEKRKIYGLKNRERIADKGVANTLWSLYQQAVNSGDTNTANGFLNHIQKLDWSRPPSHQTTCHPQIQVLTLQVGTQVGTQVGIQVSTHRSLLT